MDKSCPNTDICNAAESVTPVHSQGSIDWFCNWFCYGHPLSLPFTQIYHSVGLPDTFFPSGFLHQSAKCSYSGYFLQHAHVVGSPHTFLGSMDHMSCVLKTWLLGPVLRAASRSTPFSTFASAASPAFATAWVYYLKSVME